MSLIDGVEERERGEWRMIANGWVRRGARIERLDSGRYLAEAGAKVRVFDGLDQAMAWCVEVLG